MFTGLSSRLRLMIRLAISAGWLLAAGGGVSALFVMPNPIIEMWGHPFRVAWAVMLGVAGLVAALGVTLDRYRLEWGASWFAAAAAVPYAMTLWLLFFYGEPGRITGAFFMTGLISAMIARALLCSAHAEKLRTASEVATHVSGD